MQKQASSSKHNHVQSISNVSCGKQVVQSANLTGVNLRGASLPGARLAWAQLHQVRPSILAYALIAVMGDIGCQST